MSDAKTLRDPSRSGVRRLSAKAEAVERAAAANGFVLWRVDLGGVRDKAGLLAAMARALAFPGWFGKNWDALQDCLCDLSWRPAGGYVVLLEQCGEFATYAPKEFGTALEVFSAAADSWREQDVPFWALIDGLDPAQWKLHGLNVTG